VLVVTLTGLRLGEMSARWKHIDFKNDVIRVRETVYEGLFGAPKTKSSRRDVPMSQPVREALMAQCNQTAETEPEQLVFASRNRTPINPKNLLRRVLQPACRKLNLPVISWHSFRPHARHVARRGWGVIAHGTGDSRTFGPEDNTQCLHARNPGVAKTCGRQGRWLIVP
jgi:integrase